MKIHVHVYNYIPKPMLEELIPHQTREVFENWLDLPVLTCVFVGIYYGLTIIIVSLATGMTVFTLNIHHKGQRGHPVSPIIRKIFFGVFARVMCVKMDGDYNRNSSKVMVNFSNSYFVFLCVVKICEPTFIRVRKQIRQKLHSLENISRCESSIPISVSIKEFVIAKICRCGGSQSVFNREMKSTRIYVGSQ